MIRTALLLALLLQVSPLQTPREAPAAVVRGTASMSGIVLSDEASPKPVRNAIVMLNHTDKTYGDTTASDDEGRFTFEGVPAGRYTLVAQKDGYIRSAFGAARPGRSGTPITIADGQKVADVRLRLPRGAILTGTIRDPEGQPMPDVGMQLWRVSSVGGARRLTETYAEGDGQSDDRGVYRFWGVPAGDYVIQATPRLGSFGMRDGHVTSTADLQWARAQLQNTRQDIPPPPRRAGVSFSSVYYPAVLQRANGAVITVAAGEERRGLDMTMQMVPTSRITGKLQGGEGLNEVPEVFLVDVSGNASFHGVQMASGTNFTIDGVEPGTYALAAQVSTTKQWAMTEIVVAGTDQSVTMALQPGMTANGRVQFQGTTAAPKDLARVRISLSPLRTAGRLVMAPEPAFLKPDGTFVIEGVMPGRYVLKVTAFAEAGSPNSWSMRDARAGGQDIATVPVNLSGGPGIADINVTFTDRPTELGGRLQDATGRAAADYFIVVFSTDERTWFAQSRAIAQTRPANDGVFSVRGLPAGEYFVAALTDVERDEWFDPAFLRQLVPAAMKVTLADGEKKTQDIRITGG